MVIKKALPRAPVVLSVEERRQVVKYVELLVAVAKRAKAKRANIRYSKNQRLSTDKRKSSEEKGTRLKQKQKNKVRKFYEPCFFEQTIYPETENRLSFYITNILIARYLNDRHHCFNIY